MRDKLDSLIDIKMNIFLNKNFVFDIYLSIFVMR